MVGVAPFHQVLGRLLIKLQSLRLDVRRAWAADFGPLVPVQPKPSERVQDGLQRAFHGAGDIRILDSHYEIAAGVPGVQPTEQGRPDVANVGVARRAGGVSHSDSLVCHF